MLHKAVSKPIVTQSIRASSKNWVRILHHICSRDAYIRTPLFSHDFQMKTFKELSVSALMVRGNLVDFRTTM
jgi:hypothetical protein